MKGFARRQKKIKIDTYRCEPYCFAQTISGKDAVFPGEAKNSWLTGTASWAFIAMTQHILGIRPAFEGLLIDPCIPSFWRGFKVRRRFRGINYDIEVSNPNGVCKGVKRLEVNGKVIKGNLITSEVVPIRLSPYAEENHCSVKVELSARVHG